MYRLDYKKIKANEEIKLSNGYADLYDSFFIIRLDEDENNIIGIVKNKLNWRHFNLDGIFLDLDDDSITEREENGLFDYGDTIIYNKETKKISLYVYDYNDYDYNSDTESESDSETENL